MTDTSVKDAPGRKPTALTATALRAIKPPAKGRQDYRDGGSTGLCLRVPAQGDWVWTLRMRDGTGGLRRFVLGTFTQEQGLAWARREAGKLRQGVRHDGRDPHRERQDKIEANRLTLGTLVEDWRSIKLADRKPGYAAEAVRALKVGFKAEWEKPATELRTADVRRVLDRIRKAGRPGIASGTMRYGRAAYGWAVKRGAVSQNPFEGQDAPPVKARERVLSDGELVEVLQAAEAIGGTYGQIVRFLALTGQRREEVAGLLFQEISQDGLTWTLPGERAKNGRAHIVPLSVAARDLLPKDRGDDDDHVFAGERKGGKYEAWSQAKVRLDALIAEAREKAAAERGVEAKVMPNWRLHDLRRTVATSFQKLGVRLEVTEAVLNHVSGSRAGIVGVYQRHEWSAEKRTALDAWGEHVTRLLAGPAEDASNVVQLRTAG